MKHHVLKRLLTAAAFFLIFTGTVPLKAGESYLSFETMDIYLHPGETAEIKYTAENVSVTFDDPVIDDATADGKLFTRSGNKITAGKEIYGTGRIPVYKDGSFYGDLTVNVYADPTAIEAPDMQGIIMDGSYSMLSVWPEPEGAQYAKCTVSSSDPSVADADYHETALNRITIVPFKTGTAVFTVKSGKLTRKVKVNVLKNGIYADEVRVKDDNYDLYAKVGEKFPCPFEMHRYDEADPKDDKLTFTVTEDSDYVGGKPVASVDAKGNITFSASGHAEIIANNKLGYEAYVYINGYQEPKSISFTEKKYYINQLDEWDEYPYPVFGNEDAGLPPLVYQSMDTGIIDVSGSPITGDVYRFNSEGETVIRVSYSNDPSVYGEFKAVAYYAPPAGKIVAESEITIYKGYASSLEYETEPENALYDLNLFSISDSSIADADYSGSRSVTLYGKKAGKTELTIGTASGAKKTIKVTCVDKAPKYRYVYSVYDPKTYVNGGDPLFENYRECTLVKGSEYIFELYVDFEDEHVQGRNDGKDMLGIDAAAILKKTGLFQISKTEKYDTYCNVHATASKNGTAEAEAAKNIKVKITVADKAPGVDMHRIYNPNSGEHFYTKDNKEKEALVNVHGWTYEGVGWVAPETSKTPVYRLYNKTGGEHHYTTDKKERDALINKYGWTDEGIGWYSDDNKTVKVYREYNPNAFANNHNYTPDTKEHNALLNKYGWKDEGIAWYAVGGKK